MMARALKLDPVEFRRNNILRDGRAQATGTAMKDAAIEAVLDRLALRMNWKAPFERGNGTVKRGRGIAVGFKASISPTTSIAIVNVAADGSVTLYCSTVDMGQGSDTANAQLVAEVLNVPAESVKVVHPDTDVTPYDMATLGSRSLYHMGNAVRLAAEDAKAQARGAGARGGRAGRLERAGRRAVPEEIQDAGRQHHRHRQLHPELRAAGRQRAHARRDAVLDGRRHRRRGRGRHRDRARAR